MEETKVQLQDYADTYCGGDRYRALHELLVGSQYGKLDDYIDELNTEEADFVYCCMILGSHRAYGGEKNFRKTLKTELWAEQLELSTDDIKNGQPIPTKRSSSPVSWRWPAALRLLFWPSLFSPVSHPASTGSRLSPQSSAV